MAENKEKNLPEFDSLDNLVNFFDENDFGDFDEKLKEVHFDVDLKSKKHLIEIDEVCILKLLRLHKFLHDV